MKNLIITVCIFAATLALITVTDVAMKKNSDELLSLCEQLTDNAESNNIDGIKSIYDNISDKWNSERRLLFFMLNHAEIDNIDFILSELSYGIKENNTDIIIELTEKLKFYIDELLDTEVISLENIL